MSSHKFKRQLSLDEFPAYAHPCIRRGSSLNKLYSFQQDSNTSSEMEDLHPAVVSDGRRRSLRSQPVKKTCGEIFRHPDVAIVSVEEIFNEMIRATSMEKIERRLSDHYEEAIARLSLFEMRQAWASSKLFNDRPFRPRRLSSCPAPGAQRLATHGSQSRRRRSSNFTVMFQLPKEESEDNIGRLVNQSTFDSESDKEDECRKSSGSYNVQRGSWRNLSIVSNLANLTQDVKGFCLKQISKVK